VVNKHETVVVFGAAPTRGTILQDFVPLADSVEWRLGQSVWSLLGPRAFYRGGVPFRATCCGVLPVAAAEVLFATLKRQEVAGELPETISALELGIGLGLFGRAFLDHFRDLCRRRAADYYERLCYVAADASARLLEAAMSHGALASHSGHVEFQSANALREDFSLVSEDGAPRKFQAIFLNYLLDSLPADVLCWKSGQWQRLYLRTAIHLPGDHPFHGLPAAEILRVVSSPEPDELELLLDFRDHLCFECVYFPAEEPSLRLVEDAAPFRTCPSGEFVHSHGALRCLEQASSLLARRGFVLIADYPPRPRATSPLFVPDRSGICSSMGVNFTQLANRFASAPELVWIEPDGDYRRITWRLLARQPFEETARAFRSGLGAARIHSLEHPLACARRFAEENKISAASQWFRLACEVLPSDWYALWLYGRFLLFHRQDYPAALEIAESALRRNPVYPPIWTLYGDALYYLNRLEEAEQAYQRALYLEPDDARAYYCLSFIHSRDGRYSEALECLAAALARDVDASLRSEILEHQANVLQKLDQRQRRRRDAVANRFIT
jgi:tetratricopeptide (TPR) repeat protein